MAIRAWRRFKSWVKRGVLRIVLRIARTRIFRKLRRLVHVSLLPVSITAAGAGWGAVLASHFAFPLGYGALIGAGVVAIGYALVLVYQKWSEQRVVEASRRRSLFLKKDKWSNPAIMEQAARRF